jgi:hypothetical protein
MLVPSADTDHAPGDVDPAIPERVWAHVRSRCVTTTHLTSEVDIGHRRIDARGSGEKAELYWGPGQENRWSLRGELESVAPIVGE